MYKKHQSKNTAHLAVATTLEIFTSYVSFLVYYHFLLTGSNICFFFLFTLFTTDTISGYIKGLRMVMNNEDWCRTTDRTWIQLRNWPILAWRHGWARLMLKDPKHSVTSGYIADVSKCIRWCTTSNSPDNLHVVHLVTLILDKTSK